MLWHKTIGEGPDLVLLHGWAFNSDIFQSLVEKYKHKYQIYWSSSDQLPPT